MKDEARTWKAKKRKELKNRIRGVTTHDGKKGAVVVMWKTGRPTILDTAEQIHSLKLRGIKLSDDPDALAEREEGAVAAVLEDHALFALALVEAAYNGNHKLFHQLYRQFNPTERKKRRKREWSGKLSNSVRAVINLARHLGRTPKAREVAEAAGQRGAGHEDPGQIQKNLVKAGFERLPTDQGKGRPKKSNELSAHSAGKIKKRARNK